MSGVLIGLTFGMSLFKLSSYVVAWLISGQLRRLLLLWLTDAYIPVKVKDYILGLEFFSFDLSFMNLKSLGFIKDEFEKLDAPQINIRIDEIGESSLSTFVNNSSLFITIVLIASMHLAARLGILIMFKIFRAAKYAK
mmetsp:Transcript_22258/g.25570  ORF Transcript_22258/g.25570 Transcript_22258/m.25570 type:complete len:138 (-) Transcript_22258:786-1199(-)